jgi:hypothetical protein
MKTNRIEFPDGTTFAADTQIGPGTVVPPVDKGAYDAAVAGLASIEPTPPRTRRNIVDEIEAKEAEIKLNHEHGAELMADHKKLTDELRYFGVKRRAPRSGTGE